MNEIPSEFGADFRFNDESHTVVCECTEDMLFIQVENKVTNEIWEAKFAASFIEEMTKRTGNFKQFSVFVSMLHSCMEGSSDAVDLDLLTIHDLQQLFQSKVHNDKMVSPNLSNKRYLIMVYSAEFDKIHYPLALSKVAGVDMSLHNSSIMKMGTNISLEKKVHSQDLEIKKLKQSLVVTKRELLTIQQDRSALLTAYKQLQKEHTAITQDGGGFEKQNKLLKSTIRNLETEVAKLKGQQQKFLSREDHMKRELLSSRATERQLRARLKTTLSENSSLRGKPYNPVSNLMSPINRFPLRSRSCSNHQDRATGHKSINAHRDSSPSSVVDNARASRGKDHGISPLHRVASLSPRGFASPASSTNGIGSRRFDPTGWVLEQRAKRLASEERSSRRLSRERPSRESSLDRCLPRGGQRPSHRSSIDRCLPRSDKRPSRESSIDRCLPRGDKRPSRESSIDRICGGSVRYPSRDPSIDRNLPRGRRNGSALKSAAVQTNGQHHHGLPIGSKKKQLLVSSRRGKERTTASVDDPEDTVCSDIPRSLSPDNDPMDDLDQTDQQLKEIDSRLSRLQAFIHNSLAQL